MCGIALLVSTSGSDDAPATGGERPSLRALFPSVQLSNRRRGPDQNATVSVDLSPVADRPVRLTLASSVLGLRGHDVTAQPLESDDGRFLLTWNGQIFDWTRTSSTASSSNIMLDSGENDGRLLFGTIIDRVEELERGQGATSPSAVREAVRSTLAEVEGPYAFVFVDKAAGSLFYGRDPLGRRSLLAVREQGVMLASVSSFEAASAGLEMQEVECATLWTIDLSRPILLSTPVERQSELSRPFRLHELECPLEAGQSDQDFPPRTLEDRLASSAAFEQVLAQSVKARMTNIRSAGRPDEAHVAILFSGGLDCATLARLADRFVPPGQPIDLLNVGFENPRAIKAARLEVHKAQLRAEKLEARRRGKNGAKGARPRGAAEGTEGEEEELDRHASTIPALPPLPEADIYDVPDRLTGRATHQELVRLAPDRRWNFVEINVTYSEYCEARETVEALMHPTASVMDLSIASALYFTSRGRGFTVDANTHLRQAYTTPARVLISGLGADELLGGYSRHRNAFSRQSWAGLVEELQLDLTRLPTRNLGRDDRILSTHGREARYPFLARSVVSHLCSLPVLHKTDPRMGEGVGDKLLLRDLAACPTIGLVGAASLKKRAMQFGTRAAKIDEGMGRVKGHERLKESEAK